MPQRALSELLALGVACALALIVAAANALAATTVGDARIVVESVSGALEGQVRALVPLDRVFQDERIETGAESATEITFLDGTTLIMGERSNLTLTEVVFDADPDDSKLVITAIEGVFKFASGNLRSEAYEVRTPVATIGIRGTVFTFVVEADGTTTVTALSGEVRVANIEGASRTLSSAGVSTVVFPRRSGEDLAPPSLPGPPPPIVAARVRQMDTTIAGGRGVGVAPTVGETLTAGVSGDQVQAGVGEPGGAAAGTSHSAGDAGDAGDDEENLAAGSTQGGGGDQGGLTEGSSSGGDSTSQSRQSGGGEEGGDTAARKKGSESGADGAREDAGRPKTSDRRQAQTTLKDYKWEILGLSALLALFVYRELGSSKGKTAMASALDRVKTFLIAWLIVWIFFGIVFLGLFLLSNFGVIRLKLV
ncbi:MAG: FecR domain-containing protein [Alphaproteobacteria bacterium]